MLYLVMSLPPHTHWHERENLFHNLVLNDDEFDQFCSTLSRHFSSLGSPF